MNMLLEQCGSHGRSVATDSVSFADKHAGAVKSSKQIIPRWVLQMPIDE
jgi:hypothetical protein